MYHGTPDERAELRTSRLGLPGYVKSGKQSKKPRYSAPPKRSKNPAEDFPIVVTTYELVMNDRQYLVRTLPSFSSKSPHRRLEPSTMEIHRCGRVASLEKSGVQVRALKSCNGCGSDRCRLIQVHLSAHQVILVRCLTVASQELKTYTSANRLLLTVRRCAHTSLE
jgi:hypothetical protein